MVFISCLNNFLTIDTPININDINVKAISVLTTYNFWMSVRCKLEI